ncbi:hypothetical protein EJB05_11674, partial [Eragrostis curvula]
MAAPAPAATHEEYRFKVNELLLLSAGLADNSTVVLLFREPSVEYFADKRCLAIATPGGKNWTRIDTNIRIVSALPFAGRFYCSTATKIMVVDTAADKQPQLVTAANYEFAVGKPCLVDNDGVFILLTHYISYVNRKHQWRCKVYQVDLDAGKTVAVPQVAEHAMFISRYGDRVLSVRAGLSPSISGDTI